MRRATTPTVEISLDESITGCWYRVTFAQRYGPSIVKDQDDCELSDDGKTILVTLTQSETRLFKTKENVKVQVKFGYDNKVSASSIAVLKVGEILDEAVI